MYIYIYTCIHKGDGEETLGSERVPLPHLVEGLLGSVKVASAPTASPTDEQNVDEGGVG